MDDILPRILIVDDLFGRHLPDGTNEDRDNLCAKLMLQDVTASVLPGKPMVSRQKIKSPIAEAVFIRGQTPDCPDDNDEVRNDLEGTLEIVRQGWIGSGERFKRWSLVLLDLCFYTGRVTGKLNSAVAGSGSNRAEVGMPEGSADDIVPSQFFGLTLLKAIHERFPDLPVVILSSQSREKASVEFSKHGALAFLPRTSPDGEALLRTYLNRHGLMPEPYGLIVGRSLPLLKALRAARRTGYSPTRENILIRGERGVGKEEFAKFIHRSHEFRAIHKLISVNSAVLTTGLFASELFGIEKRKATGVDQHQGAVSRAHEGDLFFDEVKDMIPEAQAGLLRFLEDGTYTPTGGKEEQTADVRVISATNADLEEHAASGRFRDDLFDRLRRGGTIFLPPLRDRKEDIPLLARFFLRQAEESRLPSLASSPDHVKRQFSDEAIQALMDDDWPGNIRVLRDVIIRAVKDNDVEFIYPVHIDKACQDLGLSRSCVTVPARTKQPAAESINSLKGITEDPSNRSTLASGSRVAGDGSQVMATAGSVKQPETLAELVSTMQYFEFDLSDPDSLYSQLDKLDEAAAKLVVGYLLASLRMHKDHATGAPEVTKAVKFAKGKQKLATFEAYDVIKRLLKRNQAVFDWALTEPLLKQAYEQAESTRRSNRAKSKKR